MGKTLFNSDIQVILYRPIEPYDDRPFKKEIHYIKGIMKALHYAFGVMEDKSNDLTGAFFYTRDGEFLKDIQMSV
ncbi:hypothetical protein [Terribacillus sp. JSM ZJ617]|uniref:hypothetical protein n=1 Tax=Terribacillus sp. JSM ZJ617 TaxID=3342119 RepID=UPI0035A974D0